MIKIIKKLYLFIGIITGMGNALCSSMDNGEQLLAVAIMVKNEALVINKTLEPFIAAGVTHFLVYDTGSTDGTPELVQQFFTTHNLTHGLIIKEPFIDFATSRNKALDYAYSMFADVHFIIMPDAEWYLNNPVACINFCKQELHTTTAAYMMHVLNGEGSVYRPCLFRNSERVRFTGGVHEYVNVPVAIVPDPLNFTWGTSEKGRKKTAERFMQDRDILLKSYAKNPKDAHAAFFLGQTYACLQDYHNAYTHYKRCLELPGCNENRFETLYRLGIMTQELSKTDPAYTWSMALDYYVKAYATRPHRIESLVKIAGYYIGNKQPEVAYLFARHACELPMPTNEYNFVETHVYTFDRYAALSTCARSVGDYKTGLWAAQRAAAVRPEVDYLYEHMSFYKERINLLAIK